MNYCGPPTSSPCMSRPLPENRHLIDRSAVERVKRGAVLINTARGSLVDEAAVAEALEDGRLFGVATDVLAGEEHGGVSAQSAAGERQGRPQRPHYAAYRGRHA